MQTIDASLYWLIPGPRALIQRIATDVLRVRVMVVNLPKIPVPGTLDGITKGLSEAHLDPVVQLNVHSSTDIASEVGVHFGSGQRRISAPELARLRNFTPRTVLLQPQSREGQVLCDAYTQQFMETTAHSDGNVHLVTMIHEPNLKEGGQQGDIQVLAFDGGLTKDEMEAYVALRMATRTGPGSTRLMRAIVSEFAGFDAEFAEKLISLDDGLIVRIREHLGLLMGEGHNRWRTKSWLLGTESIVSTQPHVLHEFYLSEHGTPDQKVRAQTSIDQRYWRACLKAITPWIEERRHEVLRPFLPQLQATAAQSEDGRIEIPAGNRTRRIDPSEIEFNNIPAMVKAGELTAHTQDQKNAVNICRQVKPVRDDIAHLRPPKEEKIIDLIQAMDSLIAIS